MRRKGVFRSMLSVALAVVMVVLASCGGSGSEGNADSNGGEKGSVKEGSGSGEVVELRFHDPIPNPEREALYKDMIERFNNENSDINVTFESTPWDQAHSKMVTQGSSGTLADVMIIHPSWISEFASAGWVLPLDDYLAEWEELDQMLSFVKSVLMDYDQKRVYGSIYGIPDGVATHAMFVRKDWLEEIDMTLEDLDTWEGIFNAAEKMTDLEQNRYGFSYRGAAGGAEQMGMYLMAALGGKLYEEDGTCRLNTPEGLEAFERYCDLYLSGYAPQDSVNWGFSEQVQGFTSGSTGILNQNSDVIGVCRENMEDEEWAVIPFPRAADGNIYTKANCNGYSIAASTEHPEEAWRFLTFIMEPENNQKIAKLSYSVPIMQGEEGDFELADEYVSAYLDTINDPNFVRQPDYGYFPEQTEFMATIYDQETQRYLLGQQTAQETVDNLANYLTEAQQRYMESNPDIPVPCAIKMDGTEVR